LNGRIERHLSTKARENTMIINRSAQKLSLFCLLALGAVDCRTMARGTSGGTSTAPGEGGSASSQAWLTAPPTPDRIAVPAGAVPTVHLRGVGVQIYVCGASTAGQTDAPKPIFAWTLKAPEAKLLDASGAEAGAHTMGPTWTSSRDGSAVVGMKLAQVDAPLATAIPWLLLRATTHTGTGIFSAIKFIQRVGTIGGKAPSAATCNGPAAGSEVRVNYSADYFFFEGGA
jgi:hypothetical protein